MLVSLSTWAIAEKVQVKLLWSVPMYFCSGQTLWTMLWTRFVLNERRLWKWIWVMRCLNERSACIQTTKRRKSTETTKFNYGKWKWWAKRCTEPGIKFMLNTREKRGATLTVRAHRYMLRFRWFSAMGTNEKYKCLWLRKCNHVFWNAHFE